MRIGLISDTHDKLATIDQAFEHFSSQRVELIVHCGDWKTLETVSYFADKATQLRLPVRAVLGNNDSDVTSFLKLAHELSGDFIMKEGVFDFHSNDGKHIAAYHGHHIPTMRELLKDESYDIVMLGHSHKPRIERRGNRVIVNPGSTAFSIPRSKLWIPSVAIIDSNNLDVEINKLIEFS